MDIQAMTKLVWNMEVIGHVINHLVEDSVTLSFVVSHTMKGNTRRIVLKYL